MDYIVCYGAAVSECDSPQEALKEATKGTRIFRGAIEEVSIKDLMDELGFTDFDSQKLNAETEAIFMVVKNEMTDSLVRAGIPEDLQRWKMEVEINDADCFVLNITCGVLDIKARSLFGNGKVTEALRSRIRRAAQQIEIEGWQDNGTSWSLWMGPEDKMHWATMEMRLVKNRDEF